MDTYKIVYNESDEQGEIFGISIVEDAANLYDFVALSKEQEVFLAKEQEKKVLTGVVLVPNQKILRKEPNTGELYEFFLEAETIEKLAVNFFNKGYQRNSTVEHNHDNWLEGTTIYESWIVEDPQNDKSNHLGFKGLPKGTWMVSMKLSDELWEEYIKTGKAKGFSIDAFLKFEKVNMSSILTDIKKEETELIKTKKVKKMGFFQRLMKLALADEFTKIQVEGFGELFAESFEMGQVIYQMGETDYELFSEKSFDYDGFSYVTDDKGIVISKEPIAPQAEPIEPLTEVEMGKLRKLLMSLEEDVQEIVEEVKDVVEEAPATEDVEALKQSLAEMESVVGELKTLVESQEAELVELRKQPKDVRLSAYVPTNEITGTSKLAQIAKRAAKL